MSWGAVIAGVGAVAGGLLASKGSKDAAETQAGAISDAQGISAEAAAQARNDVLSAYGPAYEDFADSIQQGIDILTTGQQTTSDYLIGSSQAAADILQNTSQNVQNAVLGLPIVEQAPFGQPQPAVQEQGIVRTTQPVGGTQILREPGEPGTIQMQRGPGGQFVPQIGLAGSEAALQQGFGGAQSALRQAALEAQGFLGGQPGAGGQPGQPGAGLSSIAGGGAIPQAGGFQADLGPTQGIIQRGVEGAVTELQPFRETGQQAFEREAALTGALGPEAQQQAMDEFIESPGQKFLRERQEQALLRNQAKIGGLGGGRVRTALQEQAFGIAAQQQQQQIENLRSLGLTGVSTAGQQAGFRQQGGLTGAQIAGQLQGTALSGNIQAQIAAANNAAASQRQSMDLAQQRALAQAGISTGLGTNLANLATSRGGALSNLRTAAGQNIAGTIGSTGQQIAGQVAGLGSTLGQIDQQTAINLANLISQGGQQAAGLRTGLGTTLANLAIGQGTQQATLAQNLGATQAAGALGQNAAIQQGISGVGTALGQFLEQRQQQPAPGSFQAQTTSV